MTAGMQEPLEAFAAPSLFDEQPEEPQSAAAPARNVTDHEDIDVLGDLEDLMYDLFGTWSSGSKDAWAEYAWAALTRQGLTGRTDEVERTLVVCRLATLAGLYREFVARAFDEGYAGEWHYPLRMTGLEGEYPYLHAVAMGRVAEQLSVVAEEAIGDREDVSDLVVAIARDQGPVVAAALREDLGDNDVFASLWLSPRPDVTYPVDDEGWAALDTIDGDQGRAWLWIDGGMPL